MQHHQFSAEDSCYVAQKCKWNMFHQVEIIVFLHSNLTAHSQ